MKINTLKKYFYFVFFFLLHEKCTKGCQEVTDNTLTHALITFAYTNNNYTLRQLRPPDIVYAQIHIDTNYVRKYVRR